jgi:hypothetical protein
MADDAVNPEDDDPYAVIEVPHQEINVALEEQQHRHDQELFEYKHAIDSLKKELREIKTRLGVLEQNALATVKENATQKKKYRQLVSRNEHIVNNALYTLNAQLRHYKDHTLL